MFEWQKPLKKVNVTKVESILHKIKYELLLVGLIQHLYVGVFLTDMVFYTQVIWPINMFILGAASVGVFIEKGKWKKVVKNILFLIVLFLPIGLPFFTHVPYYFQLLNMVYVLFFSFIFWEIIKFLIKPSYINTDIISASACGYFLLIEVAVFVMQTIFYANPDSFKGMGLSGSADVFINMVYFCSITLTSIGFGDIIPNAHHTKLLTSFLGIVGQFYSVVLVGILISKFTAHSSHE
jgi:hypothetical protein